MSLHHLTSPWKGALCTSPHLPNRLPLFCLGAAGRFGPLAIGLPCYLRGDGIHSAMQKSCNVGPSLSEKAASPAGGRMLPGLRMPHHLTPRHSRTCLERGSRMDFKTLNLKGVLWNNLANRELSHQGKHRCLLHGSCCCRTHDPESQAVLCEDTVQECKLHGLQGSFACRGIPINGPLQPPTATSEGCALLPLGGRFRSRISSSAANTSTTIPHQSAPGKITERKLPPQILIE